LKNTSQKLGLVEWLKVKVLSSSTISAKKKKLLFVFLFLGPGTEGWERIQAIFFSLAKID
jgi:hypothetical protein